MPPFLARQREVLRSSPSFRLLFTSYLVSGLGTFLAVIALTIDVYDRTHSGKWVAALLIADFLPAVAIGLLLGPLVDRLSRKRLLVGADVVRLIVFVLLTFTVTPGQIVALALVAGVATGFARPAAYAGLPNLVSVEDLPRANALLRLAEQLTITAGTLLGGAIAAGFGPDPAYVINAVSFGVSAVLLLQIPRALLQQGRTESHGYWQDLGDGFRLVLHSRPLLAVLLSWNLAMITIAFVNVSEVVLAKESFDAGDFGFGLLFAANGFGAVIGALFASTLLERRGMTLLYALAIGLMGVSEYRGGHLARRLGRVALRRRQRHRERDRARLQHRARPARRTGLRPGPRLHVDHGHELRGSRSRDGGGRAARRRGGRALGLGHRRCHRHRRRVHRLRAAPT